MSIISEICIDEPPPRPDDDELSDDEVMPTPKRRGPPVSREKPPPKRRRDPPKRSQMKHPSQEEKHAWPANAPHGAGLIGHKIRVWWPHDRAWFVGHVNAFDGGRLHEIRYEDGEDWDEDLEQRRWELVATAAKRAPPPKARKPAPAPKRRAAESSSDDDAAPAPPPPKTRKPAPKRDAPPRKKRRARPSAAADDAGPALEKCRKSLQDAARGVQAAHAASARALDGYRDRLVAAGERLIDCLLYTSPSPRDKRQSRMPSSA